MGKAPMSERCAVLVLALSLCLSGCGRREAARVPAGAERGPVTLTFWHILNYEGPREVVADAVARFEAAHPGVHVEVQIIANDPYKEKLDTEMLSGTPPDVFFTWGGGKLATFARAGKVLDLTDALAQGGWRERFLPAPLDLCTVDGRVYGVPVDLACVPLWYNAALLEQHGIEPPADFDALLETCRALRAKGVVPLALGNREQWPGAFYFIYLAARTGGSALFFDALARKEGARFDDPAFVRAGELLRQLVEADAFPTGFNGVDDARARTQFLEGEAAMYLMGTWLVARAMKDKPDFLAHLRCAPFPAVRDGKGDPTTVVGGVNCGFAVSATCARPDLAVELLRYLTSEQVGEEWAKTGRIPAIRVSDEALAALPAPSREALALLRNAGSLQPYYDQYLPDRLAEEHKTTTQGLFLGTLSPQQAAERMERTAGELQP